MENINSTANKLTEILANVISERDKLKEDNEGLQAYNKDLIESNTDLSNIRNRLHEEKMKLKEDNTLLIEALKKCIVQFEGIAGYGNIGDNAAIQKAKELLNNIKKNKL